MIELETARQRILKAIPVSSSDTILLDDAPRRILAAEVVSMVDLPAFDNSAVDGYAVRALDVVKASAASPVTLRVVGKIPAGQIFTDGLQAGECVRLFTGSPLPTGADAAVMQEDTQSDPDQPDRVRILDAAKPWENVRLRGVDVKRGETLARAGEELRAGSLALLAANGVGQVHVRRQPRVALLATGAELRVAGATLAPGEIFESNRLALATLTEAAGGIPQRRPIVADSLDQTRHALATAFAGADMVVTTGGVSVGELDFVKSAFVDLGGELDFWRVAMRPGRPFTFGRWQGKFLFGLPGNPVSAFVTFLLLVRPAIRQWQGARDVQLRSELVPLSEAISNPGGRRHFLRVVRDDGLGVRAAGLQESHALKSLAAAEGLVELPPATTLAKGTMVRLLTWD